MKHALKLLNYEKRRLINLLHEMQEHNDTVRTLASAKQHTDEDFQLVKKKISQTDDAIKLLEGKPKVTYPPIQSRGLRGEN